MERLRKLIKRCRPGESIRHIESTGGLEYNRLGYYLKPGSNVSRMPTPETVTMIAEALGCTPGTVFRAFARDLGYPLT